MTFPFDYRGKCRSLNGFQQNSCYTPADATRERLCIRAARRSYLIKDAETLGSAPDAQRAGLWPHSIGAQRASSEPCWQPSRPH